MRGCIYVSLVLVSTLCVGLPIGEVEVVPNGETVVAARFEPVNIKAKIRTHEIPNGTAGKPTKPADSACSMSRFPCSVVDSVEIIVGTNPIFVPRSAFADLSDLGKAQVIKEKTHYALVLSGGDASESYTVRITFTTSRVTYRSLTSGEFPDQPIQETYYRNPT